MKRTAESRFCLVAPYEELRIIGEKAAAERGIPLNSFAGDLHIGEAFAKEAITGGAEIIISRGGTARVIRESCSVPVVEISVTGYDLLRVIHRNIGRKGKLAVIGYDNVVDGAKAIADILGIEVTYLPIAREEEIRDRIDRASDMGIELVIGDTLAVREAGQVGMEYDLITSGKEALLAALDEAVKILDATAQEREERQRLTTMINALSEGVITVDRKGIIDLYNGQAEKILQLPREKVIGRNAAEVIPNTRIPSILRSGEREIGDIQEIGHARIATNRIPIQNDGEISGAIITFQDITRIEELERNIRITFAGKGLTAKKNFNFIIGRSGPIKRAIDLAERYAGTDSTILLSGESGCGKEMFAQSIHNASRRANGPFVAVNCAAIPSNLLESELFGYADGAFTGARRGGKKGLFELAHRGTLFLDEVGEIEGSVQARILRVLQEHEVMRIGDDKIIPIDVRILAATNQNLRDLVRMGGFRQDLYYRLHVLDLEIPPLRERTEDLEELIAYYIRRFSQKYGKTGIYLPDMVLSRFRSYGWPGNVRELENVMEKMALIYDDKLDPEELCGMLIGEQACVPETSAGEEAGESILLQGTLPEIERNIVRRVLEAEGFNKSAAARRLRITRVTLNKKIE